MIIDHIFSWWYDSSIYYPTLLNGFVVSSYIMSISGILAYLIGSFLGELKDNNESFFGPMLGMLAILLCSAVGTIILTIVGPILLIALVIVCIGYGLQEMGDLWRERKHKSKN